jgi:hypothetical protein
MIEWRRPSREFEQAGLAELGNACTRLSIEVRARTRRTPEERQALADSAADALLRAGEHLTPHPHGAMTPEFRRSRGGSIFEAFGDWHDTQARALRYVVIQRAALAALGEGAKAWLDQMRLPYDERHCWHAQRSDASLAEQLRALDEALATCSVARAESPEACEVTQSEKSTTSALP